jgi:hypothetical protein
MTKQIFLAFAVLIVLPNIFFGQKVIAIDLAEEYKKGTLTTVHRSVTAVNQDSSVFIKVSEKKEEGIVWLPLMKLKNGTIEIEMRGKDVLQQSFIGVVFHGLNNSTYDAVYCRPFNFLAKDSFRRVHAIQYISHPVFTWKKLREEQNAVFEKEIINPPDPKGWFTMKLVIEDAAVKAYINKSKLPSFNC